MLFNILGHNGLVRSLDFHPIEKEVLCSSDSFDVIELWNISQCVKIKNFMVSFTCMHHLLCSILLVFTAHVNTMIYMQIDILYYILNRPMLRPY